MTLCRLVASEYQTDVVAPSKPDHISLLSVAVIKPRSTGECSFLSKPLPITGSQWMDPGSIIVLGVLAYKMYVRPGVSSKSMTSMQDILSLMIQPLLLLRTDSKLMGQPASPADSVYT